MVRQIAHLLVTSFVCIATPALAVANMADPYRPGDRAAEVAGGVDELTVERERLVFDLDELTDQQRGRVEATYEIANDEGLDHLELQFVAVGLAADADDIEVEVDDEPVEVRVEPDAPLPEDWKPAREWASPGRDEPDDGEALEGASLFFDVELSNRNHEIRVAYPIEPDRDGHAPVEGRFETRDFGRYSDYAFHYLLAPLYDWGEVGEVEIVVHPPEGRWEVLTAPELDREEDGSFSRTFDDLDADAFYIRTKPTLFYDWRTAGALLVAFHTLLACIILGPLAVAKNRRRFFGRSSDSLLRSVFGWLLAIVGIFAVATITIPLTWIVLELIADGTHVSPGWGYGILFYSIFYALFVFPVVSIAYVIVELWLKN